MYLLLRRRRRRFQTMTTSPKRRCIGLRVWVELRVFRCLCQWSVLNELKGSGKSTFFCCCDYKTKQPLPNWRCLCERLEKFKNLDSNPRRIDWRELVHEHSSYRSLWAHVKAIPWSTHSAVDQQAPQITAFSTCCTMYFLPGLGCRSVARMHHRHYLLTDWLFINKETRFSRIVYFCVNCSEHTRNKDVR